MGTEVGIEYDLEWIPCVLCGTLFTRDELSNDGFCEDCQGMCESLGDGIGELQIGWQIYAPPIAE